MQENMPFHFYYINNVAIYKIELKHHDKALQHIKIPYETGPPLFSCQEGLGNIVCATNWIFYFMVVTSYFIHNRRPVELLKLT